MLCESQSTSPTQKVLHYSPSASPTHKCFADPQSVSPTHKVLRGQKVLHLPTKCFVYAFDTRLIRVWYAFYTRLIRVWYAFDTRVWYVFDTRVWYVFGTRVIRKNLLGSCQAELGRRDAHSGQKIITNFRWCRGMAWKESWKRCKWQNGIITREIVVPEGLIP